MTMSSEAGNKNFNELMGTLERDEWREQAGFSPDIAELNAKLWTCTDPTYAREELLKWLSQKQPCLFGRLAARRGAISTCILFDEQLRNNSDDWISEQIQSARLDWTRGGFNGDSSGFVIFLISEALAAAKPDKNLQRVAQRLCELYLLREDIEVDRIYHDEIFLQANNRTETTWKWLAGINFFGSCGDGRWWHDHRVPGGIALSVNSVGHLVKSRILAAADQDYDRSIEVLSEDEELGKIDSLETALVWGMRTIHGATQTKCGKATYLVPRSEHSGECPALVPNFLKGYEHRFYEGYYHTDFTLPSAYFAPDVVRPQISPNQLDFTYLTVNGIDNPDHTLMGKGRRIKGADDRAIEVKRSITQPEEISIADSPRLCEALGQNS